MKPVIRFCALLLAAAFIAACGGGGGTPTQPAPTATFRGVVHIIPTGPPIAGVAVGVQNKTAVTAADGTFTFTGLATGVTTVTMVKDGFVTGGAQLTLTAGDNFFSLGMSAVQ